MKNTLSFCLAMLLVGCNSSIDKNQKESNNRNVDNSVYTVVESSNSELISGGTNGINTNMNDSNLRVKKNDKLPKFLSKKTLSDKNTMPVIYDMFKQKDGKIIIGGFFGYVNDKKQNSLTRLNKDGSIDQSFSKNTKGINGEVNDIEVTKNGDIFIGGYFTGYNNNKVNGLVQLDKNGNLLNSFNFLQNHYELAVINKILKVDDYLILGGLFLNKDHTQEGIVVLNYFDMSINESITNKLLLTGRVFDMAISKNKELYVVGEFNKTLDYMTVNNLAVINLNSQEMFVNTELPKINGKIYTTKVYKDTLYIGGNFTVNETEVKNYTHMNLSKLYKVANEQVNDEVYNIYINRKNIFLGTSNGLIKKNKDSK